MLIFMDTEFTGFTDTQLISIGLVTQTDQQFYAELNDFDVWRCSDFVKEVVLPQLGKKPTRVMSMAQLREKLTAWLTQFAQHHPVICYDFDGDWTLFKQVMQDDIPSWLENKNVYAKINDLVVEQFFLHSGLSDHHALHDALANKFSYRPEA